MKPTLLGHWGTTPGQNFIYVHLNRVIKKYDLDMIYIAGPGHGGPALVGNTYLEGTYSEVYPTSARTKAGLKKLFTQFSFPGGISSHVSPETPGSIHEGGELGYSLSHAFGAAFDNPELIVACVIGDGEAETGPLATAWHSNKFLNPVSDGAVLPILHLNGYKISNPTVLARIEHEELDQLLRGYGWTPYFVEGDDPEQMHQLMAGALETAIEDITAIQSNARQRRRYHAPALADDRAADRPRAGPDRKSSTACRSRARSGRTRCRCWWTRSIPEHVEQLESWMRSYRPEELFDEDGRLMPELAELAPEGRPADGRQSARQRRAAAARPADAGLPRATRSRCRRPGAVEAAGHPRAGRVPARRGQRSTRSSGTSGSSVPTRRSRTCLDAVFEVTNRQWEARTREDDEFLAPDGRVHGDAQRASVRGLAGGIPAHRAARAVQLLRGVHPHHRLDVQPARQVAEGHRGTAVAAEDRLAQLPAGLPRLAAGPQRLHPPGPRLHRPRGQQEGRRSCACTCRRTPTACCRSADHCLRSRHYVNVVVAGKQPDAAMADDGRGGRALHAKASASGSGPATTKATEPDVVMACCGDVPTLETLAAVSILREHLPELKIRVVNVVDLMKLQPASEHPHGLSDTDYDRSVHERQADHLRLPRLSLADPPADLPPHQPQHCTCAATRKRARSRRPST